MIDRSPGAVERAVATRAFRQRRLRSLEDPLWVEAVLDHSVLARLTAGGAVGREQLSWFVEVAAPATVSVRVVPPRAWVHTGLDGAFTILGFPEQEPDVAFIESPRGEFVIDRTDQVRAYQAAFDEIAGLALDRAESVDHIRRLAVEPVCAAER